MRRLSAPEGRSTCQSASQSDLMVRVRGHLAGRMTLAARCFPGQDVMALKAGHRRGYWAFVRDEKQAALAMADRSILAFDPGKWTWDACRRLITSVPSVLERIPDHGDRDLPMFTIAAFCRHSGATSIDLAPVQKQAGAAGCASTEGGRCAGGTSALIPEGHPQQRSCVGCHRRFSTT